MSVSEPTPLEEIATDVADRVCQMVTELPDRTSPDDQPEMMLVTGQELHDIVCQAIEAADAKWMASLSAMCEHPDSLRIAQASGSKYSYCPTCGETFETPTVTVPRSYLVCVYCGSKDGKHDRAYPHPAEEKRAEQCAHEVPVGARDCLKCNAYMPLPAEDSPSIKTGK